MDAALLGENALNDLSRNVYPALLGWPKNRTIPSPVQNHLWSLKNEAPLVLFLANFLGCLLLNTLSWLRFGKSLVNVEESKRDVWLMKLANSKVYLARLLLMVLKSHALLALYREPGSDYAPTLYTQRPPWNAQL